MRQIIASEMPVLPLVGSSTMRSGVSSPDCFGRVDHELRDAVLDGAGRVLSFELGVEPHARLRAEPGQLDERRVADGVDEGGVEHRCALSTSLAAGERRQDRDDVAVLELRIERVQVADVFVVQVDVDEAMQAAVRIADLRLEARVLGLEVVEQLADGCASSNRRSSHRRGCAAWP